MTRQEMIDAIVTQLMISKQSAEMYDGIELILRHGWRGYNNYTNEELKKELEGVDEKGIEFFLMCADLLNSDRKDRKKE